MSYILDALRKSDQQRQPERGDAPTLLTAQATAAPPKQAAFPFNVWLAAALVGAGIAIGWLRPWQAAPVPARKEAVPARSPLAIPAAPARALPATPSVPAHPPASPASPPAAQAAPRHESRTVPPGPVPQASREELPRPMPASPGGTGRAETGGDNRVMALSALPASIRQELPNLTISFLAYSAKPEERSVMINNGLLHQGEFIGPGLVLEQITPDGVVISYKGYRFRRGVR
jgi:general secretion pathway protein B